MAHFLYRQIEQYLLNLIHEHNGEPNFQLPSENQLARQLNTSRVSVRNALASLEEQNLVLRVKGKGTFIRQPHAIVTDSGANDLFAVILPDSSSLLIRDILTGMSEFCLKKNIRLVAMHSFHSVVLESNAINAANDLHCKGIMIMPIDGESYSDELLKLTVNKKPLVFVDRKLPGLNVNCVSSDHFNITYQAVRYLCSIGHTNIAFLNASSKPSSVLSRVNGYEKGLLDNLGHIEKHYLFADMPTHEEKISYFYHYFKNNPTITGIICGSGRQVDAMLAAMFKLGKKPDKDFDLVLIDDECPYLRDLLGIRFATISQNGNKIGYTAAETLYQQIYEPGGEPADILIPTQFHK